MGERARPSRKSSRDNRLTVGSAKKCAEDRVYDAPGSIFTSDSATAQSMAAAYTKRSRSGSPERFRPHS
jgi:hypothetical protein